MTAIIPMTARLLVIAPKAYRNGRCGVSDVEVRIAGRLPLREGRLFRVASQRGWFRFHTVEADVSLRCWGPVDTVEPDGGRSAIRLHEVTAR